MKITLEKWNAIVAATHEGINRWNARAKERGYSDSNSFYSQVTTIGKYDVLVVSHIGQAGGVEGHRAGNCFGRNALGQSRAA